MSVAVSNAETLSRPLSGRDSASRVDSHSSVEGLSGPLAVVATVVEAGVETGDLLVRSAEAGVGLADGVLGSVLVAVDVVAVFKSGNGTVGSISISGPLAVAGVELSPLLERSGSTRMRLADGVARGKLMSMHVVAVLKGGVESDSVADAISVRSIGTPLAVAGVKLSPLLERSGRTGVGLADSITRGQFVSVNVVTVFKSGGKGNSVTDSISDGGIGAPLADTVAVGSVDSGSGEEAGGRPGGEAGATVVIG